MRVLLQMTICCSSSKLECGGPGSNMILVKLHLMIFETFSSGLPNTTYKYIQEFTMRTDPSKYSSGCPDVMKILKSIKHFSAIWAAWESRLRHMISIRAIRIQQR